MQSCLCFILMLLFQASITLAPIVIYTKHDRFEMAFDLQRDNYVPCGREDLCLFQSPSIFSFSRQAMGLFLNIQSYLQNMKILSRPFKDENHRPSQRDTEQQRLC